MMALPSGLNFTLSGNTRWTLRYVPPFTHGGTLIGKTRRVQAVALRNCRDVPEQGATPLSSYRQPPYESGDYGLSPSTISGDSGCRMVQGMDFEKENGVRDFGAKQAQGRENKHALFLEKGRKTYV